VCVRRSARRSLKCCSVQYCKCVTDCIRMRACVCCRRACVRSSARRQQRQLRCRSVMLPSPMFADCFCYCCSVLCRRACVRSSARRQQRQRLLHRWYTVVPSTCTTSSLTCHHATAALFAAGTCA
jgi:hypothetical protein